MDSMFRILDASLNRATEGLRTIEDTARMTLEDSVAAEVFKAMRHDLQSASAVLPRDRLLAARDAAGDVGTAIETAGERVRSSEGQIVAAAASRTAQALRVIEEHIKRIDPDAAASVQSIRYRLYDAARNVELATGKLDRRQRLQAARIYALIDGLSDPDGEPDRLRRHVLNLIDAGVDVIQLRDHTLTDRQLFTVAEVLVDIMRDRSTLLIINDRADVAAAVGADGVHVGQDELPASAVRAVIGHDRLIGLSTHDAEQVRQADGDACVDYLGYGPIFPSTTKAFQSHLGTSSIASVHQLTEKPIFVIGGINATNHDQIVNAGGRRVALSGCVRPESDWQSALQTIRSTLDASTH